MTRLFPIALIALWIIAIAYTCSALAGMETTLQVAAPSITQPQDARES